MFGSSFYIGLAASAAVLLGGVYVYNTGYSNGVDDTNQKVTEQALQNQIKVRQQEKLWQSKVDQTVKNYETKINSINRKHADLVNSLLNRPSRTERLPDNPKVVCTAATGAELSREDGQFLAGEATRADQIREALRGCYEVIDSLGGN